MNSNSHTDIVLESGTQWFSAKVLTSYKTPEDAIVDGLLISPRP
ncbi:MAG: hypothetical protein AB8B63_23480 [Granulosicoccus sp.]